MMTLRALVIAIVAATSVWRWPSSPAAPPMTDAQKAAADEKKAKDAAAATLATQQPERSMDRAAANYYADMKAKGKAVRAAVGRDGRGFRAGARRPPRRRACRQPRKAAAPAKK